MSDERILQACRGRPRAGSCSRNVALAISVALVSLAVDSVISFYGHFVLVGLAAGVPGMTDAVPAVGASLSEALRRRQ